MFSLVLDKVVANIAKEFQMLIVVGFAFGFSFFCFYDFMVYDFSRYGGDIEDK